jgi:MazG family protein
VGYFATASTLRDLVALVARLRAPDGCPWDREQRLGDIRAYLVEEAHETAAAIDEEDWRAIAPELGDLLFQVAFLLQLGEEAGALTAEQVVAEVHRKFVSRHPHVFGDETAGDADSVRSAWERRKLAEGGDASLLAGVPVSLPALVAAYRLSQKAAGVGFEWPTPQGVLAKVREEVDEVEAELAAGAPKEELEGELGDLLFTVANVARQLGVDPERALARTNGKFRRRFAHLEGRLRERGKSLDGAGLEELEALWQEAKGQEAREQREAHGAEGDQRLADPD